MSRTLSIFAMTALAAILCAPVIIEAQNSLIDADIPAGVVADAPAFDVPAFSGSVYNEQNEMIGSIGSVLPGDGAEISGVVLSLGGFRGIGGKLVEIPDNLIQVVNDRLVIAGTTKGQLMQLPTYQFGSRS
jgi:hypothetical protein